ncbi:outer membrane receptor protein involved in Fe transport [Wenyingzhuangia heitensis]|uniref:Outer membrane receptor protein involved in Fe transport n=1 Tax=Wenyingzhuangia heitensis TaxID=1487859 RepID=A0ABX0UH11_9FLAO|nr:outer membrane beta-barrel family protein [Wenyingzhuangia heitensis]NIJ46307.1 outer membrane receptor protein involved in Fe transport [Wenyingzhuangia heitensis]
MKNYIQLFLLLMITTMFSQQKTLVSGTLKTAQQKAIPFVTVTLQRVDVKTVKQGFSNEKGLFVFEDVTPGNYQLIYTSLGFTERTEKLYVGGINPYINVGNIVLTEDIAQLSAVEIKTQQAVASKSLEKKTFDLDNVISQSGGSVLDVMKGMPGISVDQEGKVLLRGSDKVLVLIDGQQSSLTGFGNQKGLDNIPATNIEKIEIINNPSAKYDASGNAGAINIIYKKEKKEGLNGSIGFTQGIGVLSKKKKDLPTQLGSYSFTPKYIPSLDLNYVKNKVAFFLQSEVLLQEKLPNNEFTTRNYDNGTNTISQVPENRKQVHYIVKGGVDFNIDENNKLKISSIYDWEKHTDTAQVPYIDLNTGNRYRYTNWREEEITGYFNVAADYEHKFLEPGHNLKARIQYIKGWEDETYHVNDSLNATPSRDITNILATEHIYVGNVDYTNPFGSGKLETGVKVQHRDLPVEYTVTPDANGNSIVYDNMGNNSNWQETIYAAYANLIYETPTYDIEGGVRAEQTSVVYDVDENNAYFAKKQDAYDYFELFPNIRWTYKLTSKQKVSLFYNRRIDRPGEPELRMFAKSDDHELLKVGNPYLRPQFTQSGEIAYRTRWNKSSLFVAAYYKYIDNPYMRVYGAADNDGVPVVIKSYANTGSATNAGLELIYDQELLDFWKLSGNVNVYQNNINGFVGTILFPTEQTFNVEDRNEITWDAKINSTWSLKNDLQLQLSYVYLAPKNIAQGRQLYRSSLDFGAKKKIWKGKGELSFAVSDILNQYALRQKIKANGFTALYENYYETQVIRMGLKYYF